MRKKQVKPNRIDRRYRRYTPESLLKAYEAVKDKKIPVKTAAIQYGVPLTTLRDRVDRRIDANNFANGGTPTLSMDEEEILVEHLEVMSLLGYGYTNTKLQQFAGELAVDMGKKEKNKPMSNNWLYGFLNRWKGRLASLSPSSLDSNRAKCCTPEAVAYYFNNLNEIMSKYELSDKPQCIYNLDETGLKPDHRPPNVVSALSCKPQAITSPRSTTTTLIGCVNAIGNTVPPFFVFKGKRFYSELMNGASFGARGEMSESGWSNGDLFKKYLKEHFMPYARSGADDSQVILLLFDGHASHVSPSLIRWARSQNLILFVLPAHSSHFLQPLDVSLFGPFKTFYYSECSSFMQKNIGRVITRYDMCGLACKAYLKAMTPLNIQAGFRKTGIYPLSKDAVPMEKLIPAEGFREEEPVKKVKAMKHGKEAVEEFIQKKMDALNSKENVNTCPKCSGNLEVKNKLKKPKPSGRAITEDSYLKELEEYEEGMKKSRSRSDLEDKENETPVKKSKSKKIAKPKKSLNFESPKPEGMKQSRPRPDLEDKENETPVKKSKSKKIAKPKKSLNFESPKPSTSGTSVCKSDQAIPVENEDTDSEFEDETADEDLCCVCKKWTPPNHNDHPSLKIINWAFCDKCSHCVHLIFCTPVRVVRRHSTFYCPCCEA